MRKLLIALFCILLCAALVACAGPTPMPEPDREFDEAEVMGAAKRLIPLSGKINEIFWGEGIRASEDPSAHRSGGACEADVLSLETFGVTTVSEIRSLTQSVYSAGQSELMFSTVLSPLYDGDVLVGYSRYFSEAIIDPATGEQTGEYLMVSPDPNVLLNGEVVYRTDDLGLEGARGQKVYVRVPATVTTKDGKQMEDVLSIALVEEADGWRIDTPTYLVYYKKSN